MPDAPARVATISAETAPSEQLQSPSTGATVCRCRDRGPDIGLAERGCTASNRQALHRDARASPIAFSSFDGRSIPFPDNRLTTLCSVMCCITPMTPSSGSANAIESTGAAPWCSKSADSPGQALRWPSTLRLIARLLNGWPSSAAYHSALAGDAPGLTVVQSAGPATDAKLLRRPRHRQRRRRRSAPPTAGCGGPI